MDKAKILLIDDDHDVAELLRITLEANGYQFYRAVNGIEGLKLVKKICPDLIILDVMMDSITEGFHVSYKLRSNDPKSEYREFSNIPIIMMTGVSQKMNMPLTPDQAGDYLPVDEFMEKPVRIDPLLEKIRKLLKQ